MAQVTDVADGQLARNDEGDWPAQAADTIVKVVGQVRDKTAGPAITVARGTVYGLLAALLGSMVGILSVVVLVRLLEEATEGVLGEKKVWLAYAVLGVAFVLAGAWLWRKRRPKDDD